MSPQLYADLPEVKNSSLMARYLSPRWWVLLQLSQPYWASHLLPHPENQRFNYFGNDMKHETIRTRQIPALGIYLPSYYTCSMLSLLCTPYPDIHACSDIDVSHSLPLYHI